jgi:hypothetical protein
MVNLYNSNVDINSNQCVYDNFNDFIFSSDRNVFNKMMYRHNFYNMTQHLVGDIVECGVFKGSGLLTWLKLVDMYEPNSIKKVIGFDFFGKSFLEDMEYSVDKIAMKQVFDRDKNLTNDDISQAGITQKILNAGFRREKFDLVSGDISKSSVQFLKDKPGFRISILYLDMDLEDPTYNALEAFWDFIVPGGVVVFDEYAYHNWSESNAADVFIRERRLTLRPTFVKAPTAYIIK